jgi:DNA-binding MarR family transcriptional regulator
MTMRPRKVRVAAVGAVSPAGDTNIAASAYRLEDQVGFRLRKVHQRATEIFNDLMAPFEVTPMQFSVIAKLDDLGSVSQNQLGRLVAMDPATTFGVVGRLVKRGLVGSRIDQSDARLSIIELTAEGRAMARRMKAVGADVSARTLAPLTADEAKHFLSLLARLGSGDD